VITVIKKTPTILHWPFTPFLIHYIATTSYTLWKFNIAIENGHLYWIYPMKMVIFHSYVSLPEDIPWYKPTTMVMNDFDPRNWV